MGDLKLQGATGLPAKPTPVQARKINADVSLDSIKKAAAGNNLDEVVVKDKSAQRFVMYADELSVKNGALPKVGDKVTLPFIDGEATVEYVNDEINEDLGTRMLNAVPVLGKHLADKYGDKGGIAGDDSALKNISQPLTSPEELDWALELEAKVKNGDTPTSDDIKRYESIYHRYQGQYPVQKQEVPVVRGTPAPKATEPEKLWARTLEDRISTGYEPNQMELDMYAKIMVSAKK